jgi:hypothetical protein
VVLLVPGTSVTPEENWGWNYLQSLPQQGFDTCTVRLPRRGLDDIQLASEYVVHAIRTIHARTRGKVDILGHSQGGLEPRWALKFWPDTRGMVDDVISLASPHHGTLSATLLAPWPAATIATLQMRQNSEFIRVLNQDDETPGTPSYTSIYSSTDDLVQPQLFKSTSFLEGATNIRVQDVCPMRYVSHVGMAVDAVVHALVMDALKHPGGADPGRLAPGTCFHLLQPRVDLVFALHTPALWHSVNSVELLLPVFAEPPLADYARRRPLVVVGR